MPTTPTLVDMPAQRRRTARGDATQNLLLSRRQRVGSAMTPAVKPDDIGDLEPRPAEIHRAAVQPRIFDSGVPSLSKGLLILAM
jgi:hypothetical protein